jgi:hypothetical protein
LGASGSTSSQRFESYHSIAKVERHPIRLQSLRELRSEPFDKSTQSESMKEQRVVLALS